MIHHVSVGVSDLEASGRFYDAVLGSLGWRRHIETSETLAWGIVRPVFFISAMPDVTAGAGHICFTAPGISGVKGAWEGGIREGGTDDGAPGQRPEYGATYYAAYILDPDHNRVEIAVGSS